MRALGTARKIAAGLGIVLLAGAIALLVSRPEFEVAISEDRVAQQIADRLPERIRRAGVDIEISALDADFLAENAVRIRATADVAGFGVSGRAETDATSGLRYADGAFYLSDITVDDVRFALDGQAGAGMQDARSVTSALLGAIRSRLEEENAGAGAAFDRILAEAEPKLAEAVGGAVNALLRSVPVYRLDGRSTAHDLAALALREVRFTDTQAIAVLDPGFALIRIVAAVASVLLTIGIAWLVLPAFARRS